MNINKSAKSLLSEQKKKFDGLTTDVANAVVREVAPIRDQLSKNAQIINDYDKIYHFLTQDDYAAITSPTTQAPSEGTVPRLGGSSSDNE